MMQASSSVSGQIEDAAVVAALAVLTRWAAQRVDRESPPHTQPPTACV
jgi:hypothetical protein